MKGWVQAKKTYTRWKNAHSNKGWTYVKKTHTLHQGPNFHTHSHTHYSNGQIHTHACNVICYLKNMIIIQKKCEARKRNLPSWRFIYLHMEDEEFQYGKMWRRCHTRVSWSCKAMFIIIYHTHTILQCRKAVFTIICHTHTIIILWKTRLE